MLYASVDSYQLRKLSLWVGHVLFLMALCFCEEFRVPLEKSILTFVSIHIVCV